MRSGLRPTPRSTARASSRTRPRSALDPAGVRKRVQTPHGMVRARHVVLAGSTGIGAVDAPIAATVLPVSTYVAVTAPLGEKLFEAVRYTGAVADTRRAGDYYRIVGDDRLMWGGRISTRGSTPRRLKARDAPRHPARSIRSSTTSRSNTPGPASMAYAVHKMPQIGELAPGYWLASAFGGHGLNTTAMAGEMIARAILDGDDRWRLFSPYELVWAGGAFGRAAAQALLWSMQARDAVQEKLARYRDRARREADARQIPLGGRARLRKAEAEGRAPRRRRNASPSRRRAGSRPRKRGRAAAERARQAAEEARRIAEEAARAAEQAQREREHACAAAEKATRDAARSRSGAGAADRGAQGDDARRSGGLRAPDVAPRQTP